jgi:hypothetical protein
MIEIGQLPFGFLLFVPIGIGWYLWWRLYNHLRDPSDWRWFMSTVIALRANTYTPEGQPWVHRARLLVILIIPYWVGVFVLFRPS